MSHFTVYVVTKTDEEEDLKNALQPFHEYECTGIEDEYVVHVDKTKELQKDIERYYKPDEENNELGDWIQDWNGCENIIHEERESSDFYPDLVETIPSDKTELPKESYAILSHDGTELIKYCAYTNPNSKWDYWRSYDGIKTIDGEAECVLKSDWDITGWIDNLLKSKIEIYNKVKPYIDEETYISWEACQAKHKDNIDEARYEYNNQKTIKNLDEAKISHGYFGVDESEIANHTLDEYLKIVLNNSAPFWAIVDQNGNWIEHGHMGWWAISWDHDKNWQNTWKTVVDNIPDNYYIWCVDCHV